MNSASDFTLIDLRTQATAVEAYVEGWSKAEILDWLRRWGRISEPEQRTLPGQPLSKYYGFDSRSCPGLHTIFRFTEDDRLFIILRDLNG